jgi:hypothetical protein
MYPSKAVKVVWVGGAGALLVPLTGTEGVPGDPGVDVCACVGGLLAGDAVTGMEVGVGTTGGDDVGAGVGGAGFPKISCSEDESCAHAGAQSRFYPDKIPHTDNNSANGILVNHWSR